MRDEQPAAGRRDLGRHHRQQPDRRHFFDAVILPGEHQERHGDTAHHGNRRIDPPQHMRGFQCVFAPERNTENQEAVNDRGQPHGDRPEEHRHHRMAENPPRAVEEQNPAGGVEHAEQGEKPGVRQPQRLPDLVQPRDRDRKLVERQRQDAGPHGRGEPVRRELADDFQQAGSEARPGCPVERLGGYGRHDQDSTKADARRPLM